MTLDNSGNVSGRQAHLPFGRGFGESGTQEKHHFTSYERDSESDTDHAINRQYAQSVGRFMQADPYRANGGAIAPQSWNRYSYVHNMPVDAVDPLGLFSFQALDPDICDGSVFGAFFCEPYFFAIPTPISENSENEDSRQCQQALEIRDRYMFTHWRDAYIDFFDFAQHLSRIGGERAAYDKFEGEFDAQRILVITNQVAYQRSVFTTLAGRFGGILVRAAKNERRVRASVYHLGAKGERLKQNTRILLDLDQRALEACKNFPEFVRGIETNIDMDSMEITLWTDFLQALDPFIKSIIDN